MTLGFKGLNRSVPTYLPYIIAIQMNEQLACACNLSLLGINIWQSDYHLCANVSPIFIVSWYRDATETVLTEASADINATVCLTAFF